jgi:hypothetical protein
MRLSTSFLATSAVVKSGSPVSVKRKQRKRHVRERGILLPFSIAQEGPLDPMSLVREDSCISQYGKDTKLLVAARDQAPDKITSGYELQNLDKRNVEVSETIVASALESQYQPTGMLR